MLLLIYWPIHCFNQMKIIFTLLAVYLALKLSLLVSICLYYSINPSNSTTLYTIQSLDYSVVFNFPYFLFVFSANYFMKSCLSAINLNSLILSATYLFH